MSKWSPCDGIELIPVLISDTEYDFVLDQVAKVIYLSIRNLSSSSPGKAELFAQDLPRHKVQGDSYV